MGEIPGLVRSQCGSGGVTVKVPCVAVCPPDGTDCLQAASAEIHTCSPLWQDYLASAFSASRGEDLGSAWRTSPATITPTITGTETIYTTFSPASDVFTIGLGYGVSKPITYTPVYALGDPSLSTYTSIDSVNAYTVTEVVGPTPTCKFTRVTTDAPPTTNCGQCTLAGGTVELLYWPTAVNNYTNLRSNSAAATSAALFTVLNGTTLRSPTAYISFQTAYATDSCSRVGAAHTGAIIGLSPSEVSTLVHWGGKAAASGANLYGPINYADLTGLPPASVYESQQSCLIAGCRTIYPSLQPTLVVPSQMRALDEAWKDCGPGLEGLYDPPVTLTPQAVMAVPTVPASYPTSAAIAGLKSATMPEATGLTSTSIAPIIASSSGSIADPTIDASTSPIETQTADPVESPLKTGTGESWPTSFTYQPASTTPSSPGTHSQSGSTTSSRLGGTMAPWASSTGQSTQSWRTSTIMTHATTAIDSTTNALSVLVSALSLTSIDRSIVTQSSAVSQLSTSHASIQTTASFFVSTGSTTQVQQGSDPAASTHSSVVPTSSPIATANTASDHQSASVASTVSEGGEASSSTATSQAPPPPIQSSGVQTSPGSVASSSMSTYPVTTQRSNSLPAIVTAPGASARTTAMTSSLTSSTGKAGSEPIATTVESSGILQWSSSDKRLVVLSSAYLVAFLLG